MDSLPTGTVTFLYTDIEGSTLRWERYPDIMKAAVERHDTLMHDGITSSGGCVFRRMGDAFCAVFPTAPQALNAVLAAQRALAAEPWSAEVAPIRVRMGLHTGIGEVRDGDYVGTPLNRVARLMSTGYGGQVLLSQVTHDLVRDALPAGVTLLDLGEHRLKDLQRPEHVYQLAAPDLLSDFPPIKTLNTRPNNLPVQRSPMVGRERELAEIQRLLLREDVGLLTLAGPGGTGKTRLAMQVAAELVDDFEDGVWLVSLAALHDPELLVHTISQALGVREVPGRTPQEALEDYLRDKQMLLVLDNFEQVVDSAPLVAQLLAATPGLKVLVTSRQVLNLRAEQEFQVPPLSLPDLKRLPSVEELSEYEAVAFFVQRARMVDPAFALTRENAAAVAEICYRLEGLPLAIELAAARVRILPPQAMLTRLASRLKLLTGGARDLPERHQTLRGTIQWSYDLLASAEQVLFRRMSVFVRGCTLEAVEAVASPGVGSSGLTGDSNPQPPTPIDVLDGVASLVDKSLARQEPGVRGEPRIVMLDTVREYAGELLESQRAESEEIHRQHASYYLDLVQRAEAGFMGVEQDEWLERLDMEHDNLLAALDWCSQRGDVETALRFCWPLWFFWQALGYFSEGRMWIEGVLALPGAEKLTTARATALVGLSTIIWRQKDYAAARRCAEESLAIWKDLKERGEYRPADDRFRAYGLVALGMSAEFQGDHAAARPAVDEGIALFREVGDRWGLAVTLIDLGLVANSQGDRVVARDAFSEGLAITRQLGDKWVLAQVLNGLGDVERIEGDFTRAGALYEESLQLYRELNARTDVPAALHNLGYVALCQGDTEHAASLFVESMNLQIELNNKHGVAECLAGLAGVAAARKEPERAARLFGAADALREISGASMWAAERADYDRNLALARALLDDAGWQQAYAAGRSMVLDRADGLDQAVAFAVSGNR
jgi:predicted ATPase/class 3 adenylate cyclase